MRKRFKRQFPTSNTTNGSSLQFRKKFSNFWSKIRLEEAVLNKKGKFLKSNQSLQVSLNANLLPAVVKWRKLNKMHRWSNKLLVYWIRQRKWVSKCQKWKFLASQPQVQPNLKPQKLKTKMRKLIKLRLWAHHQPKLLIKLVKKQK